jgi:hypothetical protein
MSRRLVLGLVPLGAALMLAAVAFAAVEGRVAVRGLGGNGTPSYSPSLFVVAPSPPDYRLGCCLDSNGSEWLGPRYQATGLATLGRDATIDWGVSIERSAPDLRKELVDNLTHSWPVIQEGTRDVEHRVGGRPAGTIPATWILTRSTFYGADDAQYESSIGFAICGADALVKFSMLLPSGDSAGGTMGYGEYKINGQKPTDWNRQQGLTSIQNVRLEGNLPTGRVSASAQGRRVAGAVRDCRSHAIAGTRVQLQRKAGRRWASVSSGSTSATGAFSLRARGAGLHRVLSGSRASSSFRVR